MNWLAAHPGGFLLVFVLALMWPALLNGGPYYFPDSAGYLKGGEAAVSFAAAKVSGVLHAQSGGVAAAASEASVSGVRSIAYSVFAFLTRAPGDSLFGTSLLQALAVAFSLSVLFRVYDLLRQLQALLGFVAIAVFATPAPWFCVLGTPDIFAGVAILAIGLLAAYPERLSVATKAVFALLIAFSVTAHLSHIPIIGTLVALAGVVLLVRFGLKNWTGFAAAYAWIAGPALLGLAAVVAINAIGFSQASVTGKRYPIVLASSIQDGPARWYLEKNCATERFAVCELFRTFPDTSDEFLWGKQGLRERATPEQMNRIRDEESEILKRAVAAYPLTSAKEALFSSIAQFFAVGLDDHHFEFRLQRDAEGVPEIVESGSRRPVLKKIIATWFLATLLVSLALLMWLLARRRKHLPGADAALLVMVLGGCVINAAVCGGLSAVTDRYQGRVVWVLILAVAVIGWTQTRLISESRQSRSESNRRP